MVMNKRRGRPSAGTERGRDRLLAAAGELFISRGYRETTLRAVAEHAGCDVALIAYHFGSKKGLFAQAMALEIAPAEVLERALPGDPEALGVRLLTLVSVAWEQPNIARSLTHLVEMAITDDDVRRSFLEYLDREIMCRLVEYFGGADAQMRATALLTLVIGVIFGRYILQIPPLAQQEIETYLRALAPAAQMSTSQQPRRNMPRNRA